MEGGDRLTDVAMARCLIKYPIENKREIIMSENKATQRQPTAVDGQKPNRVQHFALAHYSRP